MVLISIPFYSFRRICIYVLISVSLIEGHRIFRSSLGKFFILPSLDVFEM